MIRKRVEEFLIDENRLKHSYEVANKMVELGKKKNLSTEQLNDLFLLGYLHDIGYQFASADSHHIVGGELLKDNNYKYWKEVYYHAVPNSEYKSLYLSILKAADMMVDSCGNDVGFGKRLEDIKSRYGEDSVQYRGSLQIIEDIKKSGDL